MLRECSGRRAPDGAWVAGWDALEVHALHDGDEIEPWETVLTVEGDYSLFCHLETVYLGALARRTLISRNVREVVQAANGKPILYFPARHDHHRVQTGDGYAAHIAGAIGVSTDAQASWWGGTRRRHGAARPDRGLRRRHRARRAALRRHLSRAGHRRARRLRERLGADGGRGRARARREALGRAARHLRHDGRPRAVGRDGPLRPAWRQSAARAEGARGARPRGLPGRPDRRLGRLHGGQDPRVRGGRRAGRRLRRRLEPDPRRERLHGRRRPLRRRSPPPRRGGASCRTRASPACAEAAAVKLGRASADA